MEKLLLMESFALLFFIHLTLVVVLVVTRLIAARFPERAKK